MSAVSPLKVPVLMYHQIAEATEAPTKLAVNPAAFADQLACLRDAGFTAITAGDLAAALAGESAELPDRPVVLTFDDGYGDFYHQAMPLLNKYGFTATLFMTTGGLGHQPMLDWGQLTEAAHAGIEIGAHTYMHPALDQLSDARLHEELYVPKSQLEDNLGMPIPGLAYPYGHSSRKVRQLARELGHTYAYSVGNSMTTSGSNLFTLPRLTVQRATTLDAFRKMVSGQDILTLKRDRMLTRGYSVVRYAKSALNTARRSG